MRQALSPCLIIALCLGLLAACAAPEAAADPGEEYIGLTYDVLCERISQLDSFAYQSYLFFTDDSGDPCAARFDTVDGVYACTDFYRWSGQSVSTSFLAFGELEEGMTVLEVVERVGIPIGSASFGMATLVFRGDAGYYVVSLGGTDCETVTQIQPPVSEDPSIG